MKTCKNATILSTRYTLIHITYSFSRCFYIMKYIYLTQNTLTLFYIYTENKQNILTNTHIRNMVVLVIKNQMSIYIIIIIYTILTLHIYTFHLVNLYELPSTYIGAYNLYVKLLAVIKTMLITPLKMVCIQNYLTEHKQKLMDMSFILFLNIRMTTKISIMCHCTKFTCQVVVLCIFHNQNLVT